MKKRTLLKSLFISCVLCSFSLSAQTTYHVNINNGNDTNDGLKWSTSFKNLQTAINTAKGSDTILLAAGTYTPTEKIAEVYGGTIYTTTPTNNRHRSFLLTKDLKIYGGFPANASDATAFSNRDWKANPTILSGDFNNDDNDDFKNTEENALHVVVMIKTSSATNLDGLYITGGGGTDSATVYVPVGQTAYQVDHSCGGGIYVMDNKNASPSLSNIVISKNKVTGDGGGIFIYSNGYSSPVFTNVELKDNIAGGHGGGIYISGYIGKLKLMNCNISGNTAANNGGGILCIADTICMPAITNTVISGNKAKRGGGAYIHSFEGFSKPTITNATICGNYGSGGGIVVTSDTGEANPAFCNTVIWGNRGESYNNTYINGRNGTNATYKYSLVEGEILGSTNLDGDSEPKFMNAINASYAPTSEGDYQLTIESPLINAGNNTLVEVDTDIIGKPRIYDETVDIGAYESQGTNPSNNETVINKNAIWSYNENLYVKIKDKANIHVYNMSGQLVKQINNLNEGTYTFALPKGLYTVIMSTGETSIIYIK